MSEKRKHFRRIFHLCFLFAGILPLAGQSDSGDDKPRKSGRSVWFACVSAMPDGVENPVKVMSGENLTELEIPRYMTSDPVKIADDGIMRIVREVPDPKNKEKMKYLVLAEAKVPANVREALIILAPLPTAKGNLLFQTKVQDLADFKGGDRLYINMSTTQIRVKLGAAKVAIPAGKSNIYEAPVLAKPVSMPIMYQYYHPEKKKWKLLTASTSVVMPTRRKIYIFNNGNRLGKIKKHNIIFPVKRENP